MFSDALNEFYDRSDGDTGPYNIVNQYPIHIIRDKRQCFKPIQNRVSPLRTALYEFNLGFFACIYITPARIIRVTWNN